MSANTYITSVIASYWIVSISMVYLNKVLLSSADASISAPLFVTWYQCIVTCIICSVLGRIGENYRLNPKETKSFFENYSKAEYKLNTGSKVLPLSLIFVCMITFNNLCLQYVEVSFCKNLFFFLIFH